MQDVLIALTNIQLWGNGMRGAKHTHIHTRTDWLEYALLAVWLTCSMPYLQYAHVTWHDHLTSVHTHAVLTFPLNPAWVNCSFQETYIWWKRVQVQHTHTRMVHAWYTLHSRNFGKGVNLAIWQHRNRFGLCCTYNEHMEDDYIIHSQWSRMWN